MLCMCTPAGQEEFFAAAGVPVGSRASPPPKLSDAEQVAKRRFCQLPRQCFDCSAGCGACV